MSTNETTDPLVELPRLGADAVSKCCICQRSPVERLPIFYKAMIQQCGVDAKALREHAGLAAMLGGSPAAFSVADAMGAHKQPIVVLATTEVCLCNACLFDGARVDHILAISEEQAA